MCQELEDGEDQEDKEGKRSHDCVDVAEIRTAGFRLLNFFFLRSAPGVGMVHLRLIWRRVSTILRAGLHAMS